MFLRRVELNARNWFVFTVFLLKICTRYQVYWADFAGCRWLFITKHLEIILEDIDDFIWLKSLLNSVLNSVDKLVQLIINVTTTAGLFSDLVNKVFWIVLYASIHRSIEVGLSLESLNWVCCLQTHRKNLFLYINGNTRRGFSLELEVNCLVCRILFNHLVVLETEFSAQFWNAHFDEWSRKEVSKKSVVILFRGNQTPT